MIATVFWDSQGISIIYYLEKGKTITETHYEKRIEEKTAKIGARKSALPSEQLQVPHIGHISDKIA